MSRIFILVLALMTIGIAVDLWRKEREREEPDRQPKSVDISPATTEARIENSGSTTATGGSANVNVPVTVILGSERETPTPTPASPIPEEPKQTHNIKLVRPKSVYVEHGISANGFYEKNCKTDRKAFVACLRNESIFGRNDIADEDHVTATVLYFDSNGQEIGEGVSGVSWLNDGRDSVDFKVGKQTHNVILAILEPSSGRFFVPFLTHQRIRGRYEYLAEDIYEFAKGKEISQMTLHLLGSENGLLLPPLNFYLQKQGDGDWDVVMRPS